ncbi:MAG TPA: phosphotransferase [Mycobacteriales bacterium]|nr:phosphotransferase [Mycobacteriales bacterium]
MTEQPVHGLAGAPAPRHWPALTVRELVPVLRGYDVGDVLGIRWHSPRPWSSAAIVDTSIAPVFVKRHDRRVRDAAAVAAEHAFVRHLRSEGFPTPAVHEPTTEPPTSGRWTYQVFELAPGLDRYRARYSWTAYLSTTDAATAGGLLARLHTASEGYEAAPRPGPRPLSNPLRLLHATDLVGAVKAYAADRPALAAFVAERPWEIDLNAALPTHHARLQSYLAAEQPLWGHGDWHGSNLTWGSDTAVAAIDFGLADRTCAAFDVATAVERAAIGWLDRLRGREPAVALTQVDAFLAGYAAVRGVSASAVAAFLPLVHVELALSELDYFTRIVPRSGDAELAYRYLVDHARWFDGPGQRLLRRIRASSLTP